MTSKTKVALAALLLLQFAPAAEAASKRHHHNGEPFGGAYSAYAYAPGGGSSTYNYAREVYGWQGGLYPFDVAPNGRPVPLRSGGLCWMPSNWGNPQWAPCP